MAVLQEKGDCNWQERTPKAPLPKGDEITRRKSLFGSYTDSEVVLWLKGLALDPCKPGASQNSNRRLCDQILNVRKAMLLTNTEFPRRKRKLQQFLKGNFAATSGLVSEKYNQQNCMKSSRRQLSAASSVSCLLNSADSTESFNKHIVQNSRNSGSSLTFEDIRRKQVSTDFSFPDSAIDFGPNIEDTSPLIDSDESVNGSNPLSPENLTLQDPPLRDSDDTVHSSNSSSLDEPKQLKLRRLPIPLGPRFQAEVPDWTGPVNKGNLYGGDDDSENSRWLGTRIWPTKGISAEITVEAIGKGRPDSCSCVSPGSASCIKYHVVEEWLRLQSDLGPAFWSWKFDEMGEVVSKAWTLKEQESFESLVRMNLLKNGTSSCKHALKCFPSKSRKSIVSYYFNVFIPRRMSLQIRLSLKQVDSDDEEAEDVDRTDFQKRCKARSDSLGNSKDVRTRYLRRTC
ncbi:hypothetical protein L1049_008406 [Liquidambar formosana]|uniref:ELM2 domain-containing protein n=1 Tax=Liquidambar formosana TaxID=63359 RepID=A0AAP0SAQ4_LIQFO